MMTLENWQNLMQAFGFGENRATFDALLSAHTGRGRHYHSDEHISACLRHLETVRGQVSDWKMLALAFWFHDAVYKPFSATNERDSADWAMQFLKDNRSAQDQIDRIDALIMATCHNAKAADPDMQYLIDIDLSILGARADVYDQYEKNIRREYRRVPGFLFRKKRKELLCAFLGQPKIYGSDYFHDLLEEQARVNLERAINAL